MSIRVNKSIRVSIELLINVVNNKCPGALLSIKNPTQGLKRI